MFEQPSWHMLLEWSREAELPIWTINALHVAYGDLLLHFIRVAAYLKVKVEDLIERWEAGQQLWMWQALTAMQAEHEAREILKERAAAEREGQ